MKVVERELGKVDKETEDAMKALSNRLESNKVSKYSNDIVSCLAQPDTSDSIESLADSSSRKRPALSLDHISKKVKLCEMGRSSKGRTQNESKNLSKWIKETDWLPPIQGTERLRSLQTPSSFAEASILARRRQEMENSAAASLKVALPLVSPIPRPPSLDLSTSSLDTNSAQGSPEPFDPPNLTENSACLQLSPSEEGELSVSVMQMKLDPAQPANDSFSSSPDTEFNKGAACFISLLENTLARAAQKEEAMKFEDLLIQMLDLSVDKKLGSTFEITEILKTEGWDASQVAKVWRVSTGPEVDLEWDLDTLKLLGGESIQADVWQTLKSNHLTGNPKRTMEQEHLTPRNKRARVTDHQDIFSPVKGINNVVVGNVGAVPLLEVLGGRSKSQSTPLQDPKKDVQSCRRKKKIKRPSLVATPKITRWFHSPARAAPERPVPPTTPTTPCPATPATNIKGDLKIKKRVRSSKLPGSLEKTNKILFPARETPSLPTPKKEADSQETPNQVFSSEPASRASSACGPADTKPNQQKTGRKRPSKDVMTGSV